MIIIPETIFLLESQQVLAPINNEAIKVRYVSAFCKSKTSKIKADNFVLSYALPRSKKFLRQELQESTINNLPFIGRIVKVYDKLVIVDDKNRLYHMTQKMINDIINNIDHQTKEVKCIWVIKNSLYVELMFYDHALLAAKQSEDYNYYVPKFGHVYTLASNQKDCLYLGEVLGKGQHLYNTWQDVYIEMPSKLNLFTDHQVASDLSVNDEINFEYKSTFNQIYSMWDSLSWTKKCEWAWEEKPLLEKLLLGTEKKFKHTPVFVTMRSKLIKEAVSVNDNEKENIELANTILSNIGIKHPFETTQGTDIFRIEWLAKQIWNKPPLSKFYSSYNEIPVRAVMFAGNGGSFVNELKFYKLSIDERKKIELETLEKYEKRYQEYVKKRVSRLEWKI